VKPTEKNVIKKMYKNKYWLIFLALILVGVFWYTATTVYSLYIYYSLSQKIPVSNMEWSTHKLFEERYAPQARYQFEFRGKSYSGEDILKEPIYRNSEAVDEIVPILSKQQWSVWFNPSNPSHSSLDKTFPLKESISLTILWALLFYFLGLGYYVAKRY
jgi:hypothetical protein